MLCHTHRAKNEQKSGSIPDHSRIMAHPTDRGELVTTVYSFSLGCVAKIDRVVESIQDHSKQKCRVVQISALVSFSNFVAFSLVIVLV